MDLLDVQQLSFLFEYFVMGNRKNKSSGRPAKRKFTGNRFTQAAAPAQAAGVGISEAVPAAESASKRKLSSDLPRWIFENDSESDESSDSSPSSLTSHPDSTSSSDSSLSEDDHGPVAEGSGTQATGDRLVSLPCLRNLISAACSCKYCGGEVTISEAARSGLASTISIACCNEECLAVTSLPVAQKSGRFFECNRRSVLAARVLGFGHVGLQKFCGLMNLPPPVQLSAFQRHQRVLCKAAKSVACISMNEAAKEVRALNVRRHRPEHVTAVTFDGTWMKRGFSSLHGAFTAIDWEHGKVLDVHVATKYCQGCSVWKARRELGKISSEQYQQWKAGHTVLCSRNTDRSSPGMETEAAVTLWGRSVQERSLEYRTYIGDGDSKGVSAVQQSQPYGPDVEIVKEECVGHIQKRLGSGLRKLKKEWAGKKLPDGLPIRGAGRLTDDLIERLQMYYGNAIRSNTQRSAGHGTQHLGWSLPSAVDGCSACPSALPHRTRLLVWLATCGGWCPGRLQPPRRNGGGYLRSHQAVIHPAVREAAPRPLFAWSHAKPEREFQRAHLADVPEDQLLRCSCCRAEHKPGSPQLQRRSCCLAASSA